MSDKTQDNLAYKQVIPNNKLGELASTAEVSSRQSLDFQEDLQMSQIMENEEEDLEVSQEGMEEQKGQEEEEGQEEEGNQREAGKEEEEIEDIQEQEDVEKKEEESQKVEEVEVPFKLKRKRKKNYQAQTLDHLLSLDEVDDDRQIEEKMTFFRMLDEKQVTGGLTPFKVQHFWRDFSKRMQQDLLSLLQQFKEKQLKEKLLWMIKESGRKKQETGRNKEKDKWYLQVLQDKTFEVYLVKLFSKQNFEKLIAKMKALNAQSYRNSRIPLLAFVTRHLTYSEFRKFRDFYFMGLQQID